MAYESYLDQLKHVIHTQLDPIWESNRMSRSEIYDILSKFWGSEFHVSDLEEIENCRRVLQEVRNLRQSLGMKRSEPRKK